MSLAMPGPSVQDAVQVCSAAQIEPDLQLRSSSAPACFA